jgi:hypothetical protein
MDVFQEAALQELADLKAQFEAGSGFALLAAIRVCANRDLVMPSWVAEAYIARYDRILNCHAASWDEVFGKPYKGKHLSTLRQRRRLRFAVYNRIRQILKEIPDTPIDDSLFEVVGAEFGIRKTLCNELYYEAQRFLKFAV